MNLIKGVPASGLQPEFPIYIGVLGCHAARMKLTKAIPSRTILIRYYRTGH